MKQRSEGRKKPIKQDRQAGKRRLEPRREPLFGQYTDSLPEADATLVTAFFTAFEAHCALARDERAKLRQDLEDAILYYIETGVPLTEALERLDVKNLGGFYVRPPILWYALDDAAKIYPLSMKQGRMAVFRLSAYLTSPVVPPLLQMALTFTIKRFPSFATTVKKGVFWHYLDTAKRRYEVLPDNGLPCRPLPIARSGSQSFRVLYWKNRVSVEFFHILTDGTGGMVFLKTLIAEYLRLCGVPSVAEEGVLDRNELPCPEETENAFDKAERTERSAGFVDRPAVQLSGRLSRARPCRILHFKMDARSLQAAARDRGCTVTAYLLSLLFLAGRYATDEMDGEMSVQVPINMRKFFPSRTVRNFALYCGVRLPICSIGSAEAILPEIVRQLAEKSSAQAMREMMSATERLTAALRYIPLFIKAPAARLAYGFLGDRIFSNTLSNLGVVSLPAAIRDRVESMDFVLGTAATNRAGCSLVTYGTIATLSIAKNTDDPSFEERLYMLLHDDGVTLCVEGSERLAD